MAYRWSIYRLWNIVHQVGRIFGGRCSWSRWLWCERDKSAQLPFQDSDYKLCIATELKNLKNLKTKNYHNIFPSTFHTNQHSFFINQICKSANSRQCGRLIEVIKNFNQAFCCKSIKTNNEESVTRVMNDKTLIIIISRLFHKRIS